MPDEDKTPIAIRLNILGSLEIERDGESLPPPKPSPAHHLLALLAVEERYTDQKLVDVLWPGDSLSDDYGSKAPRGRLNRAVSDVRTALGVQANSGVLRRQNGIVHRVQGNQVAITTDFDDFQRLRQSEHDDDWRAALALVRGPVAEGVPSQRMGKAWIEGKQAEQERQIKELLKGLDAGAADELIDRRTEKVLEGQWSPDTDAETSEPVAASQPAQADSSPPHRGGLGRYWPRWTMRRHIAVGIIGALLTLALSVVLLTQLDSTPIPPEGSVINAETGEIVRHPHVRPSEYPAEIDGGFALFHACDVSTESHCGGHNGSIPIKVKVGDVVAFLVKLNDGSGTAVHNVKLEALPHARLLPNAEAEDPSVSQTELEVRVSVRWPETIEGHKVIAEPDHLGGEPKLAPLQDKTIYFQLPHPGHYKLEYIPGSTILFNEQAHFFHHLPDGIMRYGIELENVGSPPSCFWCAEQYIRYADWHARVVNG